MIMIGILITIYGLWLMLRALLSWADRKLSSYLFGLPRR